jgi:protein subunit release factor B
MTPKKRYSAYLDMSLESLKNECEFNVTRGSGPGGQNRNSRDTAVTVIHKPTGFSVYCCDSRSQSQNRKTALVRLSNLLREQAQIERRKKANDNWRLKRKVNRHNHTSRSIAKQKRHKQVKVNRRKPTIFNE